MLDILDNLSLTKSVPVNLSVSTNASNKGNTGGGGESSVREKCLSDGVQ